MSHNPTEHAQLSKEHLATHETFEGAATMFHIAIAVVAISVVAKRKEFWFLSMAGGAVGLVLFAKAFHYSPPALRKRKSRSLNPLRPSQVSINPKTRQNQVTETGARARSPLWWQYQDVP